MSPQEWYGCFRHSWQNLLVPEAFQHPGKYNRGVLDRIYDALQQAGIVGPRQQPVMRDLYFRPTRTLSEYTRLAERDGAISD